MLRRLHLVVLALSIAAVALPARAATPSASISGVVRNSAGMPQIGALVQILRPDLSVVAIVYTNDKGRYSFPSLPAGRYSIKAMGASFLPSMRENVRVRTATVVNLTLNTLAEIMAWLPAQRSGNANANDARTRDDWKWTLSSAANRPLLRWLEDGPLVVVTDAPGARPKLKARLLATGQEGTFGENGERYTALVEATPATSRELLARVDFAPGSDAALESMLGFRQELGYAGAVQSMASISIEPEVEGGNAGGLEEALFDSAETLHLGDQLDAEFGSEQVLATFRHNAPNTALATLPYANLNVHRGDSTLYYRLGTALPGPTEASGSAPRPRAAMDNGELVLEHGLHQEIGWQHQTNKSQIAVAVYSDHLAHPVVEAMGTGSAIAAQDALYDRGSAMLRGVAPDYSATGFEASFEHNLGSSGRIRLSYANGGTLLLPSAQALAARGTLNQTLAAARPRRAQTYSITLSGTLEGSGTRWSASYRWQPEDAITAVTPFTQIATSPYLNLHLRQPLRRRGNVRVDALLDGRNLLADGYHPITLSDGSVLLLAQQPRALGAGLAFTF